MPDEWDGNFSENLDEDILPSNLPTNSDETDLNSYQELGQTASQASDSTSKHPSEEGLWFGEEHPGSVWWTELEQVYVIGFVDADDQPLGLYANRAEIDGSWWDVIVGWEALEDAERHSGLVEATIEAEVGIVLQVVEPAALQTAASNAGMGCSIQREGALFMPPQRMEGTTDDAREQLEQIFGEGND